MEQFLIGAGLMTVSALTFVAYRHPRVYEEVIFDKLYVGAMVVFLAVAAWHTSNRAAFGVIEKYVPAENLEKAKEAVSALTVPIELVMLCLFGLVAYLILLSWLARHFEKEHRREHTRE